MKPILLIWGKTGWLWT